MQEISPYRFIKYAGASIFSLLVNLTVNNATNNAVRKISFIG